MLQHQTIWCVDTYFDRQIVWPAAAHRKLHFLNLWKLFCYTAAAGQNPPQQISLKNIPRIFQPLQGLLTHLIFMDGYFDLSRRLSPARVLINREFQFEICITLTQQSQYIYHTANLYLVQALWIIFSKWNYRYLIGIPTH